MTFIHLHTHSCYSLLDGLPTPREIVEKAKGLGMTAVAITDHGNLFASFKFHKICREQNIKPILGSEFYFVHDRKIREKGYRHVVLLAKNKVGWLNIMKLSSLANESGFYYRPRIDIELIKQHHDGVIALSGCRNGIISASVILGNESVARSTARSWKKLFGDDLYLEIMPMEGIDQQRANNFLVAISEEEHIELVATADSHYLEKSDAELHEVLFKIRNINMSFDKDLWFKTRDEMFEALERNHPSLGREVCEKAIDATGGVMDKIEKFDIKAAYKMPEVEILIEQEQEHGTSYA